MSPTTAEALRSVRAASLAEVAWRDPAGAVQVRGVVPLVGEVGPVLALPYAVAAAARSLGAASEVLLSVSEPRSTGSAYAPLLLRCRPTLVEDPEGDRFCAELLEQELRRYPPSRVLADSVMLRREHWWWLARLLVDLEVLDVAASASRAATDGHLLVVDTGTVLQAGVARVAGSVDGAGRPGERLAVDVVAGTPTPGAAVLFGQDASFPDLERWGQWSWRGRWDGAHLEVTEAPATTGVPPVPGVLARWRRQRELERACRAGLASS